MVGVHKDDLIHGQREENIQEEDFVSPNDSLLLRLLVEPTGPLVLHQLVLEAVRLGYVRDGVLKTHPETTPAVKTSSGGGGGCKHMLGGD